MCAAEVFGRSGRKVWPGAGNTVKYRILVRNYADYLSSIMPMELGNALF
jgi:hypothetical protein